MQFYAGARANFALVGGVWEPEADRVVLEVPEMAELTDDVLASDAVGGLPPEYRGAVLEECRATVSEYRSGGLRIVCAAHSPVESSQSMFVVVARAFAHLAAQQPETEARVADLLATTVNGTS